MGRRGLVGVAAAGALVAAIGASGVLATFSDRATTGSLQGQNRERITSSARGREIDIQIAPYLAGPGAPGCGGFSNDLTTGVFSTTVADVGGVAGSPIYPTWAGLCVRNVGEQPIARDDLVLTTFALEQSDDGCTGDEGVVDPDGPTCGSNGEALPSIFIKVVPNVCGDPLVSVGLITITQPLVANRLVLGQSDASLEPDEWACFTIQGRYDPPTTLDAVAGQSDVVRWRFRLQADDGE